MKAGTKTKTAGLSATRAERKITTKKYIEVKENTAKVTHLAIELYYDLGGMNYFTSRAERRGYYLSVTPVERSTVYGGTTEIYTAFTGLKQCIKEVTRKSAKAEAEAEKLVAAEMENLIAIVCKKNGLEVAESEKITA